MKKLLTLCSALTLAGITASAFSQSIEFQGVQLTPEGNFGIGLTDAQSKLHVNGDGLIAGTIKGVGHGGNYGSAALVNGFSLLGNNSRFVMTYDDLHHPGKPQAIQITNVDTGVFKTFVIDHPMDPERYLVHATLEGPEGAVFYRGEGKLQEGSSTIKLPSYFEALTKQTGRSVQLTAINGFDPIAVKASPGGTVVDEGTFTVVSNNPSSEQRFYWEVKAVRADKPTLIDQPYKNSSQLSGFGPYRILTSVGNQPQKIQRN